MTRSRRGARFVFGLAACLAMLLLTGPGAVAEETVRVGKAQPDAFSFVPVDVGIEQGIFKAHGLEIETAGFAGDAKLQQAVAADAIDIAIGSGPALAFVAKGNPELAVAAMANQPLLLVLSVQQDGPIHDRADLKGKTISVSTAGSLTEWLVRELSRQQGWGPDGITIAALGSNPAQIAAFRTKQIDGYVADVALAYKLEAEGTGRILVRFGDLVTDFHIHVIYASNKIIAEHPDRVRAFLAGWFDTIRFIRANKPVMVQTAARMMNLPDEIVSRTYDEVVPMFSDTGRFNPKALAVLSRSFVQMNVLPAEPDMSKL